MDTGRRLLSIGEVSLAAGLRASALRYYEDAGLIQPSARVGGRRRYAPSVLRRLGMIALCQEVGFTVSEIAEFLGAGRGARKRWRMLAERKLAELNDHIERAKGTRRLLEQVMTCGCGDPAECELVRGAAARRLLRIQAHPRRSPSRPVDI